MEVFGSELHAFGIRAFTDEAISVIGTEAFEALLRPFGVTAQDLADPEHWVSLEFTEAFLAAIVQASPDPLLFDRAARNAMTPKYLGPIYTFVRAFGDINSTFDRIAKATPRFNKTGTFIVEKVSPGGCTMRFTPAPACRERTMYMCRNRRIQLATVPTIFDLPPAQVNEPQCILKGDGCCEYEFRWRPAPRRWSARLGGAVGIATALVFAQGVGLSSGASAALSFAFLAGGWALGRVRELRQDVGARVQDVTDHQDALTRSMSTNEARFAELLEAKSAVDAKVEQRTRELREASARLSQTLAEIQQLDRAKTDFFNNVSHELRSPLTLILAPLGDLGCGPSSAWRPRGGFRRDEPQRRPPAATDQSAARPGQDRCRRDECRPCAGRSDRDFWVPRWSVSRRRRTRRVWRSSCAGPTTCPLSCSMPPGSNLPSRISWRTRCALPREVAPYACWSRTPAARYRSRSWTTDRALLKRTKRRCLRDSPKATAQSASLAAPASALRSCARQRDCTAGDVKLVSQLGKGATFTLQLPRRMDVVIDAARNVPQSAASSLAPSMVTLAEDFPGEVEALDRSGPTPNAAVALVVEDNPELRVFIANVLATRYRVHAVSDGAKALLALANLMPDVIVSDVAMPIMDGYALCRGCGRCRRPAPFQSCSSRRGQMSRACSRDLKRARTTTC